MIQLAAGASHLARLAVSARIFGLVVLAGPVLWTGGSTMGLALVAVAMIWVLATGAERLGLDSTVTIVLEGALIGTVCALSVDASLAVLGALAVPPFTAALRRGLLGAALSVSAELVALVGFAVAAHGSLDTEQGAGTFTWIVTGAGLGLTSMIGRAGGVLGPSSRESRSGPATNGATYASTRIGTRNRPGPGTRSTTTSASV